MLSIRGVEHGDVILRVPNLAVREPLFTYELKTQSRIREFIDGEAHIKGFLLAYLGLTNYYQISPEWESNKGYADFFFKPSPSLPDIEYVYLLEVYLGGRGDGGSVIVTESRPVVY